MPTTAARIYGMQPFLTIMTYDFEWLKGNLITRPESLVTTRYSSIHQVNEMLANIKIYEFANC